MASSPSPSLRLELMATGDQSGTWGDTTNTNLGTLLEQAITGYLSVAQGDVANLTLTTTNYASDQARNAVIRITGALTATRNVVVQTAAKLYTIANDTTGGFSIVVKTSGGTGVSVPPGAMVDVYSDGTNVVQAANYWSGSIGGAVYLDAGAAVGPNFDLFRDSTSPAVSDILGRVTFNGRDSAGNKQEYASVEAVVTSPTSTTEGGSLDTYVTTAGTRTRIVSVTGSGTSVTGTATATSTAAGAVETLVSTDAGATLGPALDLYRNSASPAANDVIGGVRFYGVDSGAAQELYARIQTTIVDATAASEDAFVSLAADLAGTLSAYMHWGANAAGTATANATGLPLGQLSFPAAQNASSDANTLDDYEEGTWTPTDGSGAGLTFSSVGAIYIKIGKLVTCHYRLTFPVTASGANITFNGLPFTTSGFAGGFAGGSGWLFGVAAPNGVFVHIVANSATQTSLVNGAGANVINSSASGQTLSGTIIYQATA